MQVAFKHFKGLDIEDGIVLAIDGAKVRDTMFTLTELHLDDNSKELRYDWHTIFSLPNECPVTVGGGLAAPTAVSELCVKLSFTQLLSTSAFVIGTLCHALDHGIGLDKCAFGAGRHCSGIPSRTVTSNLQCVERHLS